MPGSNPSHRDDRLDDEIDSLLRSVEADLEPDPAAAPSAAARAWVRWFRRPLRPRIWVRTRALMLPNDVTGWVPRRALGSYHFVHTHLVVDRTRLTAMLLRDGRKVFATPVSIWVRTRAFFARRRRDFAFYALALAAEAAFVAWLIVQLEKP
jgi:hypothetical protein